MTHMEAGHGQLQRERRVLIAEQLMLLSLDPTSGRFEASRSHLDIDSLAAAALLLDLMENRRLRFNAGFVAIETHLPVSHMQLTAASQALGGHTLRVDAAIDLLVSRLPSIATQLLESLVRRDLLHRVRGSWWPGSGKRYPMRSLQARNEAVARVAAAARATTPNLRGTGMLLLVEVAGRLPSIIDGATHEAATARLRELALVREGDAVEARLLASLRDTLLD